MKHRATRKQKKDSKKYYKQLKKIHKKSTVYTHTRKANGRFASRAEVRQIVGTILLGAMIFVAYSTTLVASFAVEQAQAKEELKTQEDADQIVDEVILDAETSITAQAEQVIDSPTTTDWQMSQEQIKDYVLERVELAGLSSDKVDKIVTCESNWNPNAVNAHNNVAGVDYGLFQINSHFHSHVSIDCMKDIECSTDYAIKLIKKQGYRPWVCANRMGIK